MAVHFSRLGHILHSVSIVAGLYCQPILDGLFTGYLFRNLLVDLIQNEDFLFYLFKISFVDEVILYTFDLDFFLYK